MSSFRSNNNDFDNLLIQSLMGRLQIRPPYLDTNSFLSQTLDDFLQESDPLSDNEDSDPTQKSNLAKEESKLEKEIIRIILSGKTDSLKTDSGQAVAIGDHHVCVSSHDEAGSGYRVWEWHGHIMLFDEETGYSPEYIYGNYFERVQEGKKKVAASSGGSEDEKEGDKEGKGGNLGLRELIGDGGSSNARILQRNVNVGASR